jgi:hypothetical protein
MTQRHRRVIRKKLKRLVGGVNRGWEGMIGDGAGTIELPGHPDLWYVRPLGSELPLVVRSGAAPRLEGTRVWVDLDYGSKRIWRIQGVTGASSGSAAIGPHADTHLWGSSDPVYIDTVQIINSLVYASSGMTIKINPGFVVVAGKPVHILATTIDLSNPDHVPVSGAVYVLVRADSTGAITIQDGTPVAAYADLSWADVPAVEEGYALLGFVRLYDGQTKLSKLYINPDVTDVRFSTRDYSGNGIGSPSSDIVTIASPGGTLNRIAGSVTIIDDAKHNGFPILLKLATGDLAVFYKQATSHAYDADSIVLMRTSTDNGATWSSASTVLTDATYDIGAGGGVVLSTGRIVLMINLNTIGPDGATTDSTRIIYSDDDGANWSAIYTLDSTFTDWDHSTGGNIVELPDRTLRLALFGQNTGDTYASVKIYTSSDEGETWGTETAIANGEDDSRNYQEPNLVQLQNGQLLCMMRSDTSPVSSSQFYRSLSNDNGATWSDPVAIFVATGAPRTIQLKNGMLLCIYRDATDLQADYRISRDNGYSWEVAISLSTGASSQMSYASAVEYDEGMIGVAWGDEDSDTNSDLYYCQFSTVVENGQLVSNVPDGIPPLVVSSDTVVPDLNADMLDGKHANEIGGGSADPTFVVDGLLAVETEVGGAFIVSKDVTITKVYIHCEDPGSAGSTKADINLNGVTIFTTQGNRPELAYDDANGWASGVPDITDLVEGDVLTLDIDQVATASGGLSVTVAFEETTSGGEGARVFNDANLTISNALATVLTFNSEDWDVGGCHSTVSNTSRLIAPVTGKYTVVGQVWFVANSTGIRGIYILKNGTVKCQVGDNYPHGTYSCVLNITTIVDLAVGDYVELSAYQNTGGNLDVRYLSDRTPYFMMQRMD